MMVLLMRSFIDEDQGNISNISKISLGDISGLHVVEKISR